MCLYKNTKRAKIAKEDIICYKILATNDEGASYRTPYIGVYVNNDELVGKTLFMSNDMSDIDKLKHDGRVTYVIGYGYIHTYKNFEDAVCGRQALITNSYKYIFLDHRPEVRYRIFKCIIPKGIKYHEGYAKNSECQSFECNSYASKSIRFIEEIKNYD